MLILKGNNGKLPVFYDLQHVEKKKSCIIEYAPKHPYMHHGDYWVDEAYGVHGLCESIREINFEYEDSDEDLDYLMIYTNKNEDELEMLFNYLQNADKDGSIRAVEIIVACK